MVERRRRHEDKPLDFQGLRRRLRCWPRTAGIGEELRRWIQACTTMVPSAFLWAAGLRKTCHRSGALPPTNLPSERGAKMEDSTIGDLGQDARPAMRGLDTANQGV